MSTTTTPPLHIVQGTDAAQAHARLVAGVAADERCNYEFTTPQEIIHFDTDLRDAGVPIRRWVLGDLADPIATAFCFRATWNTPRHTFWGHIRVAPHHRNHGHGRALLQVIEQWAAAAGARALRLMAHPGEPRLRFLAAAGYQHIGTEQLFHLPIAEMVLPALDRDTPCDILTLAEYMRSEPDAIEQACQLHAAISLDVPMPDEPVVTLHKFRRLVGAFVDPAHYIVAAHNGVLVGEAILVPDDDDAGVLWQHATGVLPAYRGLGIASRLKRAALLHAQQLAKSEIRTWMETENAAMMQINAACGFRPLAESGSTVRLFHRELRNGAAIRC
jgi:GNAT superfamily N-acetyltransferase